MAAPMNARGALELPKLTWWGSGLQRGKAAVLKQGRLLREERAAEQKRRGNKDKKTNE